MAKDLSALVRLNDWQVDQKRRALADELTKLDALELALRTLIQEMDHEQAVAATVPTEGGLTYAAYAVHAMERRDLIKQAIAKQHEIVAKAREDLRDAFLEFKKFEITEDRRVLREDRERAKADQAFLDEVALGMHVRKDGS